MTSEEYWIKNKTKLQLNERSYNAFEMGVKFCENNIADIKANCDLVIEGRDVKIKELEKENERLRGDLELWESGGCRATNLFKCGVAKELREQLTKAKELLERLVTVCKIVPLGTNYDVVKKAEQFLKEIGK